MHAKGLLEVMGDDAGRAADIEEPASTEVANVAAKPLDEDRGVVALLILDACGINQSAVIGADERPVDAHVELAVGLLPSSPD